MKLVMDERVKHRLIGLAVILSIGAIFAPAIMKKSSQRIDGNVSVSVQLPVKPVQPDLTMTEEKAIFETAKVAHVELPKVTNNQLPLPNLAKAAPLSKPIEKNELVGERLALADEESEQTAPEPVSLAREEQILEQQKPASDARIHKIAKGIKFAAPAKEAVKTVKIAKPIAKAPPKPLETSMVKSRLKKGYAVQLATFSQQANAQTLISRLKNKGYNATANKIKTHDGFLYKVIVGQVNKKEQAQVLQAQLASAVQLKGFIITTGEG